MTKLTYYTNSQCLSVSLPASLSFSFSFPLVSLSVCLSACLSLSLSVFVQEEQNRGKPNWEHLNEDLHVLVTVEDAQNRAEIKLKRAVEEVNKLLVPAVSHTTSDLYNTHILCYAVICVFKCNKSIKR